jgi:hypothetical protein
MVCHWSVSGAVRPRWAYARTALYHLPWLLVRCCSPSLRLCPLCAVPLAVVCCSSTVGRPRWACAHYAVLQAVVSRSSAAVRHRCACSCSARTTNSGMSLVGCCAPSLGLCPARCTTNCGPSLVRCWAPSLRRCPLYATPPAVVFASPLLGAISASVRAKRCTTSHGMSPVYCCAPSLRSSPPRRSPAATHPGRALDAVYTLAAPSLRHRCTFAGSSQPYGTPLSCLKILSLRSLAAKI